MLFRLALMGILASATVQAQTVVTSPPPSNVSVTVYRDGLALITETRSVTLPAGESKLVFEGVADTLIAASASVDGLKAEMIERNFDYDKLNAANIISKSIGKTVTLIRTNPTTGKVSRIPATIVSAGKGIVLSLNEGAEALHCSGLPERLELDALPAGLSAKPKLSIRLKSGKAGAYPLKLTYLATGFRWSANYVAKLNPASDRIELTGWISIKNNSGTSFKKAQVQVVAGTLNLMPSYDGGDQVYEEWQTEEWRDRADSEALEESAEDFEAYSGLRALHDCYPLASTRSASSRNIPAPPPFVPPPEIALSAPEEIIVKAAKESAIVKRETLGDYQLYRLPFATDLNARQTKQLLFLDKKQVKAERIYSKKFGTGPVPVADQTPPPDVIVRFENRTSWGLGEPLPKGIVRVTQTNRTGNIFAGADKIEDRTINEPIELIIGQGLSVAITTSQNFVAEITLPNGRKRSSLEFRHSIFNANSVPAMVEIRQFTGADSKITHVSLPYKMKEGSPAWAITLPAGKTKILTYTVETERLKRRGE